MDTFAISEREIRRAFGVPDEAAVMVFMSHENKTRYMRGLVRTGHDVGVVEPFGQSVITLSPTTDERKRNGS